MTPGNFGKSAFLLTLIFVGIPTVNAEPPPSVQVASMVQELAQSNMCIGGGAFEPPSYPTSVILPLLQSFPSPLRRVKCWAVSMFRAFASHR